MAENDFQMVPVTSSQIAAVGYDGETREMRVEFANGSLYSYEAVPAETYEALIAAPSVGQFFNANVKHGFKYTRLS